MKGPDGVYALQVLAGEHAVFFPEAASGREWMGVYTIALTTSFLGRTLLAFRLPTALASAGTVFIVFWLGRLLFGRGEGGRETPWRGRIDRGRWRGPAGSFNGPDDYRPGIAAGQFPAPVSRALFCPALVGVVRVRAGAEMVGGLRWQACAPGCCRTLTFRHALRRSCFSFLH